MNLVALAFGIVGVLLSCFFLLYGVKGGFIEQKILADFFGNYATGNEAVKRGVLYIVIGLFFLFGSIIILASLWKKHGL